LRARARRRQREADLAEGRGDADIAAAALSRLLGAEPGTVFRPTDAPGAPSPLRGDEAEWIDRGVRERPAIRGAADRAEAARRAARLEGRGLLPEVLAYGQLQDDRNSFSGGAQSYAVGAFVRWSAFDPSRGRREAAAQADLRAAEQDVRATTDQVRLEAASAYRRAQAAREQWAAASGGAEDGREALRVIQERRREGLATLTDELETEAASLAAELMELRAAAAAAIADASLDRAVGGGN
jgi:outer membrane protein TolC